MKQRPRRKIWILLLFVVLAGGVIAFTISSARPPIKVRVAHAERGRVENIITGNSVGTVEAVKTAVVSSEIPGKILTFNRRPGDEKGPVKKGDAIVEIDESDIVAEWKVTHQDIETSELRVQQARLRKEKLDKDLERLQGTDEPKQTLERLEKEIKIAEQDEKIAQASKKMQEEQLKVIELRKAKTRVMAPFDGLIAKLHAEDGESVTAGRQLFTILSSGPLLIRVPLDEIDMPRVKLQDRARVKFDGYPDPFEGNVIEIMSVASTDQKNNRTIDVKVRLKAMPEQIRAGMSCNVEVIVAGFDNRLRIPTHLIHDDREGKGKFVFLVEGARAKRRFVKIGLTNWDVTEIVDGIAETDQIVMPLQYDEERTVAEGVEVQVVP